jgi:nifR3 family TIM-barrel protein
MVSARGLLLQSARTARFLEFGEDERPIGAQLFGTEPGEMAAAASVVLRLGFDFVDINMGCPARKVTAGGAGAALLSRPRLAGRIVRAAVSAADLPVTVKLRSGFGPENDAYLDVAGEAFAAGAAAVTLHARTRGQMFSGRADWGQIARLKREFPDRVVIGNGDVARPEDAFRMVEETGCDAVMIGRAALGNPWIFSSIRRWDGGGGAGEGPSPGERKGLILRHGEEMHRRRGDAGIREMRKHLGWYSRGIAGASEFRGLLAEIRTLADFRSAVERFF